MKIKVTQRDIDRGECSDANRCPVARAVKRETHRKDVRVYGDSIHIPKDGYYETAPKKVDGFVRKFDDGEEVKPFTFTLKNYKRKK